MSWQEHSPLPWQLAYNPNSTPRVYFDWIADVNGAFVVESKGGQGLLARIVASVNFCAGLGIEEMEGGVLERLGRCEPDDMIHYSRIEH